MILLLLNGYIVHGEHVPFCRVITLSRFVGAFVSYCFIGASVPYHFVGVSMPYHFVGAFKPYHTVGVCAYYHYISIYEICLNKCEICGINCV